MGGGVGGKFGEEKNISKSIQIDFFENRERQRDVYFFIYVFRNKNRREGRKFLHRDHI
jgi:hypothetical protein